ncbi:hypothetical protein L3X38_004314 [Prunus dulcis]|uniref:Uncharacterized protein n=1 Tax=Prunus dulcis TaxID=3755 RepID=A0AAD5F352_PRUDU|nr:hypothetical protein L3X38_004314 [Prunus dulcis]
MEAQKRGSAKGKCKVESTVQQTRVGRDAFFNFMKKERHEMGKVANEKLDHKVQEEISNKWRKLNTTEKATYGSALEELHSNVIRISADEFGRVMGLKNTGEDVQLDRPVKDGKIIQAEVQRSVLELTDKVMSEVRSFMKDARHEDVNQTKEDGPPKIRDEGGENVVKKKGEESRKLKEKGLVHVKNPWTPLPDGQTFSEPEV